MFKPLIISFLFLSFTACSAGYLSSSDYESLPAYEKKRNKDILESREILLTSLFGSTTHIPEEIILTVDFEESGKTSLSKENKSLIADFTAKILSYEDYVLVVEGYQDFLEHDSHDNSNKISKHRAEAVKKALIKNGADKDKIIIRPAGILKSLSEETTEEPKERNKCVIIKAELW